VELTARAAVLDKALNNRSDPSTPVIKVLRQFKMFPEALAVCEMMENQFIADFNLRLAKTAKPSDFENDTLTTDAENLAQVAKFIEAHNPERFSAILTSMRERIPGITNVDVKVTEDKRLQLRFQDGHFKMPFLSKVVSDGTVALFAYLVLLNSPAKWTLLCVEKPENGLYSEMLQFFYEDFIRYSEEHGQIFVATHSSEFLNAADPEEVFYIVKENGFSKVVHVSSLPLIASLCRGGEKLGYLLDSGVLSEEANKA
jgi:predicted ATPase